LFPEIHNIIVIAVVSRFPLFTGLQNLIDFSLARSFYDLPAAHFMCRSQLFIVRLLASGSYCFCATATANSKPHSRTDSFQTLLSPRPFPEKQANAAKKPDASGFLAAGIMNCIRCRLLHVMDEEA
jgi:hypothetical protein